MKNLTFNINMIDDGKAEALTAEITELLEKYNFTYFSTKIDSEKDELTFLPATSLKLYSPFED